MKVSEVIKDLQDNFKPDDEVTIYSIFGKEDSELFFNDERPIPLEQWVKIATIMDTHEDYWKYHQANIDEVMMSVAESVGWVYEEETEEDDVKD